MPITVSQARINDFISKAQLKISDLTIDALKRTNRIRITDDFYLMMELQDFIDYLTEPRDSLVLDGNGVTNYNIIDDVNLLRFIECLELKADLDKLPLITFSKRITELVDSVTNSPLTSETAITPTAGMNIPVNYYELGSSQSINVSVNFNQNDGGLPTAYRIFRDEVLVSTVTPFVDNVIITASDILYRAEVDYAAGAELDINNFPIVPAGTANTSIKKISSGLPWLHGTSPITDLSAVNLYTDGIKVLSDSNDDVIVPFVGSTLYPWVAIPKVSGVKLYWGDPDDIVDSGNIGGATNFLNSPITRSVTSTGLTVNFTEDYDLYVANNLTNGFTFVVSENPVAKVIFSVSKDNLLLSNAIRNLNFEGDVNIVISGDKATITLGDSTNGNIVAGSGHIVQDEGLNVTQRTHLNFKGASVVATDNPGNDSTDITISALGGGHIIQDEGTPFISRSNLNFVGSLLTVTDDAFNDRTIVTLSGISGTDVSNTPSGNIIATDSQAAINELDTKKEPVITATTAVDYYRGDKTFQTLNSSAVGLGNVPNTDATLRANHTGTQAISTITSLQTELDSKLNISDLSTETDLGTNATALDVTNRYRLRFKGIYTSSQTLTFSNSSNIVEFSGRITNTNANTITFAGVTLYFKTDDLPSGVTFASNALTFPADVAVDYSIVGLLFGSVIDCIILIR